MVTIYIDNQPHQVAEGQNLLQACLSLGFDLPYFCWHPALHAVGSCRQCAVKLFKDAEDTKGRIVMSCLRAVSDGLRLSVDDPEARAYRQGVIAEVMANHPHDCPVCDEGGECHLQDMAVMTGHTYRQPAAGPKRTYRSQDLGPFVNHEMNRCLGRGCRRCLRFYRDHAGGRDLEMFTKEKLAYFGRRESGCLESELSGNLVEICPTGVFTDKTLKRHYTRKWDLQTAPSICMHCSLGCNTIAGERYGQLRRIRNRFNGEVNGYYLCDRGRYGYEFVNSPRRIRRPLVRAGQGTDGRQETVATSEALLRLAPLMGRRERLIGIGSPRASLEANFALRTLVGPERFCSGWSEAEAALAARIVEILSRGPARSASLGELARADAVFILGEDVTQTAPLATLGLRQAILNQPGEAAAKAGVPRWNDTGFRKAVGQNKGPLVLAVPKATKLDDIATQVYHAAPDDLARLGFAVAHALDPQAPAVAGLSSAVLVLAETIAGSLRQAAAPLVISGTSCRSAALVEAAANVAWALCAAGRKASLSYVLDECNIMGLALLGAKPLAAAAEALKSGAAETLIVLENDLYRRADAKTVDALLGAARHVVAIDHLDNATTRRAEIVLPAATFAEASGTVVNNEGRAQRSFGVFAPADEVRASWRWIRDLMAVAGGPAAEPWQTLDDVIAALAAVPLLPGVSAAAPAASFRVLGMKIPRQAHRAGGRGGETANVSVHEPQPPADPDSPLAHTMEGYQGQPPAALVARYWAPGWNSVAAMNKFQREVGGPMRGGDPGRRLLEPAAGGARPYFAQVPAAFQKRGHGEWLIVPAWHVFGSEELSVLSPGVAERSPGAYLGLAEADAAALGVQDGEMIDLTLPAWPAARPLAVKVRPTLPAGVAELPVGLPELSGVALPAWGRVGRGTSGGMRT